MLLRGALNAELLVGLKMNVARQRTCRRVTELLPALKKPTISPLRRRELGRPGDHHSESDRPGSAATDEACRRGGHRRISAEQSRLPETIAGGIPNGKHCFPAASRLGRHKPATGRSTLYERYSTGAGERVHYPKMPTPEAPDLKCMAARLKDELDEIARQTPDARPIVLAHSLGGINWMHFAASRGAAAPQVADRVLLVAPPYIVPQVLPIDVTPAVAPFFPPPCDPAAIKAAARETVLIASDTDDYATYDQSCGYARDLDIPTTSSPAPVTSAPTTATASGPGSWTGASAEPICLRCRATLRQNSRSCISAAGRRVGRPRASCALQQVAGAKPSKSLLQKTHACWNRF